MEQTADTFTGDHVTEDASLDNSSIHLPSHSAEALHFSKGNVVVVENTANRKTVPLVVTIVEDQADGMVKLSSEAAKNLKLQPQDEATIHGLPDIAAATRVVIIPLADTVAAIPDNDSRAFLDAYFSGADRPLGAKEFLYCKNAAGAPVDFLVTEVSPGPYACVTSATSLHANDVAIDRAVAEHWAEGKELATAPLHPSISAANERLQDAGSAPAAGGAPHKAHGGIVKGFKRFFRPRTAEGMGYDSVWRSEMHDRVHG